MSLFKDKSQALHQLCYPGIHFRISFIPVREKSAYVIFYYIFLNDKFFGGGWNKTKGNAVLVYSFR